MPVMRKNLLILALVFILLILISGTPGTNPPAGFPDRDRISSILRDSRPADVQERLTSVMGPGASGAGSLRAMLRALDEIERASAEIRQRIPVEIYRAWLLAAHGYDQAALSIIRRLTFVPQYLTLEAQADIALIEASLELRAGNASAAAAAADRLASADVGAAQALRQLLAIDPTARSSGGADSTWPLASVLLLALMAVPAFAIDRERRLWLKRFPEGQDRIAPYHAFKRSPLAMFLVTAGSLLVLALGLPRRLGVRHDVAFAIIYWMISYTFTLIPFHRLDLDVRKGNWSLREYVSAVFRLHLLRALPLAAPLAAFFILRTMSSALPWWVVNAPWSPALGFAVLTAVTLLAIPFLLPAVMGMRRISSDQLPRPLRDLPFRFYRWPLPKIGIANAVSFGYFRASHSIAFTGELLDGCSAEDVVAVATHEEAHLSGGHLFLYFLAMVDLALAAGLWAAVFPLPAERLLMFGPTVMQGMILFAVWLITNRLFTAMGRRFEFEADRFAAERVGREPYIQALTRLARANFMPVRFREADNAPGVHPSLTERKHALRGYDGRVFEPAAGLPSDLVLALWRSRLALEWNRGEQEAKHICSLDDDPPGDAPPADRLAAIARRQARFGAECLLEPGGAWLEIIECAQKLTILTSDPSIPQDRVCALCSGGMREALAPDTVAWASTPAGCRISRHPSEMTQPAVSDSTPPVEL